MKNLDEKLHKLQLEAGWVSRFGKAADVFLKAVDQSLDDRAGAMAGKQKMQTRSGEDKPMPEGVAKAVMYLRNTDKIHSALEKKFIGVCDKTHDVDFSIDREEHAHCVAKAKLHSIKKTLSVIRAKKKSCGAFIQCHKAYDMKIQGLKMKKQLAEEALKKVESKTFFKTGVKFGQKTTMSAKNKLKAAKAKRKAAFKAKARR